jgi:hypothetical protein
MFAFCYRLRLFFTLFSFGAIPFYLSVPAAYMVVLKKVA